MAQRCFVIRSAGRLGSFLKLDEKLQRVNIEFSAWDDIQLWQKRLNLTWLDTLATQEFGAVFPALDQAGFRFQVLEFTDGSRGLLRVKLPATVMLVFDETGALDLLFMDFRNPFRELIPIKTVSSFHP